MQPVLLTEQEAICTTRLVMFDLIIDGLRWRLIIKSMLTNLSLLSLIAVVMMCFFLLLKEIQLLKRTNRIFP